MAFNLLISQHQPALYLVAFLVGATPGFYVLALTLILHAKQKKN